VELARPFAVVDRVGGVSYYEFEQSAHIKAKELAVTLPEYSPYIVVRLTAERVEEPIPEAKSGWEWRAIRTDCGVRLDRGEWGLWVEYQNMRYAWRQNVPPVDHAHVEALLKREGVDP
jgi:hypothetical protein